MDSKHIPKGRLSLKSRDIKFLDDLFVNRVYIENSYEGRLRKNTACGPKEVMVWLVEVARGWTIDIPGGTVGGFNLWGCTGMVHRGLRDKWPSSLAAILRVAYSAQ
ncbi:hypothetical protein M0802_001713 [Mischocyttarus mexicanus]|nr:hypothetical protein M0802_001713 [Mischocyttarus mexicanus]